ncbi:hypothetical protein ES703_94026 [subsurface metagenome]
MKVKSRISGLVMVMVVLLLFLSSVRGLQANSEALTPDFLYPAKVERVIDGDTIVVDLYLGLDVVLDDQFLRLYGIDAWEVRGEEREKGLLAKEFLITALGSWQVIIEIRPEWGRSGRGKYGRWLAVIYVAGVNVNDLMVDQDHALISEE